MSAVAAAGAAPGAPAPPPPVVRGAGHAGPARFSLRQLPVLPGNVRESRHRLLIAVLALHVPAILLVGVDRHLVGLSVQLALPVLVAVLGGRFLGPRVLRSHAVVLGLAWSSYAVVHVSGGGESHLQPLFVIALIALYQDLELLTVGLVGELLALIVPAVVRPSLVFSGSAVQHPWTTVLIHGVALLGVSLATSLAWRRDVPVPVFAAPVPMALPEPDPDARESLARAREAELTLAKRQTSYALMTNLARRNQSLIGRQLATLDELERDERDPDVLAGLFALDHLATRMRRNAENLLVLAGAPASSRGFAQPVPIAELLRGAAAEVEQYARVDVSVGATGAVAGHVVSDVAHLLAELLDNALACSPPDSRVGVGSAPHAGGGLRLWVADEGIGMTTARLAEHNALLAAAQDEDEVGATLGFPVVRRLAARHQLHVTLTAREAGRTGLIAYVDLPAAVVHGTEAPQDAPEVDLEAAVRTTTLPGRRAARRVPVDGGRARRNELAVDAKQDMDAFFAPTPMPVDVDESADAGDLWAEPAHVDPAPAHVEPAHVETPDETPLFAPVEVIPGPELPADPAPPVGGRSAPVDDEPSLDGLLEHPLSKALDAWAAQDTPPSPADTVVPSASTGRATLTRRIPQQALREAGGLPPSLPTFEPGPELPAHLVPPPDPARAQELLQSYRAGLSRGRVPATTVPSASGEDSA